MLYDTIGNEIVIKLKDFDQSFDGLKKGDKIQNKDIGTSYYKAPEVILQNFDSKCDVWSCGVVMYILLCGRTPFDGKDDHGIEHSIKNNIANFDEKIWNKISSYSKDLIRKMLERRPNVRLSADSLLKHEFFRKLIERHDITNINL